MEDMNKALADMDENGGCMSIARTIAKTMEKWAAKPNEKCGRVEWISAEARELKRRMRKIGEYETGGRGERRKALFKEYRTQLRKDKRRKENEEIAKALDTIDTWRSIFQKRECIRTSGTGNGPTPG